MKMLKSRYNCVYFLVNSCVKTGGRIVPRFQELTPDKLGKVYLSYFFFRFLLIIGISLTYNCGDTLMGDTAYFNWIAGISIPISSVLIGVISLKFVNSFLSLLMIIERAKVSCD